MNVNFRLNRGSETDSAILEQILGENPIEEESVSTEEIREYEHPYLTRKLASMAHAESLSEQFFGQGFDLATFWSGRPDIIVEVFDRGTDRLKKIVIEEIKHTNRVEYAITGTS